MEKYSCDFCVVGGGAAGMMAAVRAAERGLKVIILDPNRSLGRKVRITGKGRCNVTNQCGVSDFMKNIPGDGRFLYSSLSRFGPSETMSFFEGLGVPLKVERGRRVFPVSDNANDIADALSRKLLALGVSILKTRAHGIETAADTENGCVRICGVRTELGEVRCKAALLSTGGISYPATGSDGEGQRIAAALGHTVSRLEPSLVPLESNEEFCTELQGFSLVNVTLRAYDGNREIYSELGEMLFTHFGISGPLVLSASSHMRDPKGNYRIEVDLKPGLDENKLDDRILRDFNANINKDLITVLPLLTGRSMAPVVLKKAGIDEHLKCNSVTREQRAVLREIIKSFRISISGKRPPAEAIVTSGGVNLKEVNPRTMESRLINGLFFAGEILDVDAYTGGYNLQIAWSTGHLAGESVLKEVFL